VKPQPTEARHELDLNSGQREIVVSDLYCTHTLLKHLCVLHAYPNSSSPSEMPASLPGQILDHDTRENRNLGLDVVQDTMIRKVESIGDLFARPS